VRGPAAGLAAVDAVDGLDGYRYFWSTRADLLRRLGRNAEALAEYALAISHNENAAERAFLERRRMSLLASNSDGADTREH